MLKLLAFCSVLRDVASNIGRRLEADRSVYFNKPHSAVEVEAKQLTEYHVMPFREKRTDQFLAVWASGAKVLGAQIVLFLAGDLRLDGHNLRSKRIVIVALVQLQRVLQVHLENKTLLVFLVY